MRSGMFTPTLLSLALTIKVYDCFLHKYKNSFYTSTSVCRTVKLLGKRWFRVTLNELENTI